MTFAWRAGSDDPWIEISEGDTTLLGFGGEATGGATTLSAHWVRSLGEEARASLGLREVVEPEAPTEDHIRGGLIDVDGEPTREWLEP